MSKTVNERSGLAVISDLLDLTRRMAESEDADFLVDSVERRDKLMDEYDRLKVSSPYAAEAIEKDKPEISRMIAEIIELDKRINQSLNALYTATKHDLEGANAGRKILNYTNNAISASGSYMDYKK